MDIIQEILVLYYEINGLYIKLYKLELNGKNKGVEFVELIDVLKQRIEYEKELFSRFYENLGDELGCSVLDDGSSYSKRMIDYMNFYDALNVKIYEDDSEEEIIDKVQDIQYAKLYKSCSRNAFLVYLSFLQESIASEMCVSLRDKIMSFKYYNSFVNHDVEECLVDTNFEVAQVNYVNLYFIAETLGLDLDMCDNIILDCYKDMIEVTISQILSISDNDYYDDQKKAISINNQSMLRAALSLMSSGDYNKNKDWIYGLIYELTNDGNKISMGIINSIIENMNKDKMRVRKISMRPLND